MYIYIRQNVDGQMFISQVLYKKRNHILSLTKKAQEGTDD